MRPSRWEEAAPPPAAWEDLSVVQQVVGGEDPPHLCQSVVPARRPSPFFSSEDDGWSDHGADRVQVGVEAHRLALHGLGVGVVHGIFKGSLAVVVLMHRTARVLGFRSGSVERRTHGTMLRRRPAISGVFISPSKKTDPFFRLLSVYLVIPERPRHLHLICIY